MGEIKRTGHTETELLRATKLGSTFAFNELYMLHHRDIYSNLRRLMRDDDTAREVTQDTFLRVWEKRVQLDPDKSFPAYLCRVSRNIMIDFYRKAKRNKQMINNLEHFIKTGNDPLMENITPVDEEALLMNAIEMLPPKRKKIFTLCKLESKSYEQVSALLGISASTISDHIVKATKAIRSQLTDAIKVALILFVPFWLAHVHEILKKII
ncbi:RNA polymerase sigma factor [Pedobacter hartonius]|nr:RNA polymerase sigma factor [Pedobacter hartonius]